MFSDDIKPSPLSVKANLTVTFTAPKIAHILNQDQESIGELKVAPIGTPLAVFLDKGYGLNLLTLPEIRRHLPRRLICSHKGDYGHVAFLAGSRGKAGAAVLCSWAALKAGSGLVTLGLPEEILKLAASYHAEIMTEGFPGSKEGSFLLESAPKILDFVNDKDAIGMGPGLTTHDSTTQLVRSLLPEIRPPVILDADGLNAISSNLDLLKQRRGLTVLTPHPGEFARLTGFSTEKVLHQQLEIAREFSSQYSVWLVLKTFRPLIATPAGDLFVSPRGNPGMASAGMGDALTGILASLVGRFAASGKLGHEEITRSICLAVFLHGLAGDLASGEGGGETLTTGDLIAAIGRAYDFVSGSDESGIHFS